MRIQTALIVVILCIAQISDASADTFNSSTKDVSILKVSRLSEEEKALLNAGFEEANRWSSQRDLYEQNEHRYANPKLEQELISAILEAGFPRDEVENALRHARCESDWNPNASNTYRGGHHSIWQIQGNHHTTQIEVDGKRMTMGEFFGARSRQEFVSMMYDIYANAKAAYLLWRADLEEPQFGRASRGLIRDGWGPWKMTIGCRNRNKYKGIPWDQIITVWNTENS